MPNKKKVVCRCIDVNECEITKAIEGGRKDIESLKRALEIGTGPCQGKSCMSHVVQMLARSTKKSPNEIGTMKSRQPVQAVELSILAKGVKSGMKKKTGEAR